MWTVEQLKDELSDLLAEIMEEIFGTEGTKELRRPIKVGIIEAPTVRKFLEDELAKLQLDIPGPEHFAINWSAPQRQNVLLQNVSQAWVRTVASRLLPMARTLTAELRRRREVYQGDTITTEMMEQLHRRFPTTH